MLERMLRACRQFDEIARAYYGQRPWCYPTYVYYSLLRVSEFVIFRKDLIPAHGDPFAGTEFQIRRLSIEELQDIRENIHLPKEFYCDASRGWKTCYAVFHHGQIAYIHWVCYPGERSRFFRCKGDVAELNYNITLPRFRGHGLSVKAMDHTCEAERSRGTRVMVVSVHNQNIAMIKCMKRSGFEQVGTIKALGQLNRKIAVTTNGA